MQELAGHAKSELARQLEMRLRMLGRGIRRPTPQAIAIFLRSFSLMLGCGIRVNSALVQLSLQGDDLAMRSVASGLADEVSRGNSLSSAMNCFPNAFSNLHVSLVKVGERTGKIEQVLAQLAENEERMEALAMKFKSALTYPAFVLCIGCVLLIFGPPYLFAGILPLLKNQGETLPWLTRAFIWFSEAVRNPLVIASLALVAFWLGNIGIHLLTYPTHAYNLRLRLLKVPVLGRALRILAVARCANSFALQMEAGNDIVDILRSSALASADVVLQTRMESAVTWLKAGRPLTESLERCDYFPGLFLSVLKVGEETGEMSALMRKISELYEQEIDQALETLASLLEPFIMLFLGGLVGLMMLAIMLPLSRIISSL